jgi:hypothetical protein
MDNQNLNQETATQNSDQVTTVPQPENVSHKKLIALGVVLLIVVLLGSSYILVKKSRMINETKKGSLTESAPLESAIIQKLAENDVTPPIPEATSSTSVSYPTELVRQVAIEAQITHNLAEANDKTNSLLGGVILLPSGDLAYQITKGYQHLLFLNDEKIADNVLFFMEMAKDLVYISDDYKNNKHSLFFGNKLLATEDQYSLVGVFNIEEIEGKLAYTVYDKTSKQMSLFYDGKKITTIKNGEIKKYKKTSGGFSYIVHDYTKRQETLFYNGKPIATSLEIPEYLEINKKPAYTTFAFVGKGPSKEELEGGYVGGDFPTEETLYFDGKKIITTDDVKIYPIDNKLAYVTGKDNKKQLFYNGQKIAEANNFEEVKGTGGVISYVTQDYTTRQQKIFLGNTLLFTTDLSNPISTKEIDGKIAYTVGSSTSIDSTTFYDGKTFDKNTDKNTSLFYKAAKYVVPGPGPCYVISIKRLLTCGDKLIAEDVQNYAVSKNSSSTIYFLKLEEKASSTIASIYKAEI